VNIGAPGSKDAARPFGLTRAYAKRVLEATRLRVG
jgi:hypothetical protein